MSRSTSTGATPLINWSVGDDGTPDGGGGRGHGRLNLETPPPPPPQGPGQRRCRSRRRVNGGVKPAAARRRARGVGPGRTGDARRAQKRHEGRRPARTQPSGGWQGSKAESQSRDAIVPSHGGAPTRTSQPMRVDRDIVDRHWPARHRRGPHKARSVVIFALTSAKRQQKAGAEHTHSKSVFSSKRCVISVSTL